MITNQIFQTFYKKGKIMPSPLPFLDPAEDRESFFRRIGQIFVPLDWRYKLIDEAYEDAKRAFEDKFRDGGERYFEHVRRVALIIIDYLGIRDHEIIIAGLLHDIVEDSPFWTIERVREKYGDRVAYLVQLMTKPSLEDCLTPEQLDGLKAGTFSEEDAKAIRDQIYYGRFEAAPRDFFLIKLPDVWDNITTIWDSPERKRRNKIKQCTQHYLFFSRKYDILRDEIQEAFLNLVFMKKPATA